MQRSFKLVLFFLLTLLSLTSAAQAAYIDNGDTVTDTVTGLEWQKATAPGTYTWQAALAYCEGLPLAGKSDWRLPDRNELRSLVDYSRYNPAIDPVFAASTKSSYYWSSTTTAGHSYYAWLVGFSNGYVYYDAHKSGSYYVRAVRGGQSGAFGAFDHFAFDQIGPVATGASVQVTVRAIDKFGQPMTGFSGPVTLLSDAQGMQITSSTQAGGVTVFTVSFAQPTAGNQLHAQSASMYGNSNSFAIGNGESEVGLAKGRVVNSAGVGLSVTVHLQDGTHDFQAETVNGTFEFTLSSHIPAGRYFLWTEIGDVCYGRSVNLGTGINFLSDLIIRAAKPPVILVPGFMGSNQSDGGGVYPGLPKKKPASQGELVLHDPVKKVGWRKLRADLEAAGFEVFDCPWDWRYTPDDAKAQKFLKDTIAQAKLETGAAKVDVVSHSMGGLLVRAYIQGDAYPDNNDIDRFAMVGTPNHGSLLAYPLWEGGDAVLADFMTGCSGGYGCNLNPLDNIGDYFYSATLDKLWKEMRGGHAITFYNYLGCASFKPEPKLKKERSEIRDFLHQDVTGLGSLLITDDYCLTSPAFSCGQISPEYENDFLIELNGDSDRNRLSDGTVNTKIFASNSEEVVKNVNVKIEAGNVFPDGEPQRPFTFTEFSGDGTVLFSSALLPSVPYSSSVNKEAHGFLVNKFRPEIKEFLAEGRTLSPAPAPLSTAAAREADPAPDSGLSQLSLSVNNGCAPLLTGPDNARNGIDLEAGVDYQEGADTVLLRDGNAASVSLSGPAAGIYEIKLTGTLAGTANIVIAWLSEEKQEELAVDVYYNPTATTFRLQVDPNAVPVLSLVADIGAPQELATENSSGNTLLHWSAPLVGTPVSYKVYSQQDFQNSLTPLTTVSAPATSLTTSHPYNSPRMLYAVSAVDAQGNESVLSEVIDNQPVVITSHELLLYDHDGDGDVDGVDLVDFIVNGTVNAETLAGFAKEFGKVGGQ